MATNRRRAPVGRRAICGYTSLQFYKSEAMRIAVMAAGAVGAKVIVLPRTTEARTPAQRQQAAQQVSMTSSYAPPSLAQRPIVSTWASIHPNDLD